MNTKELVTWIRHLISINKMYLFYNCKYFQRIRKEVLREQHYECQKCKEGGKLTIIRNNRGVVHHCKEVREYPELALSKYYVDELGIKHRNLIVLCHEHHEMEHNRFCVGSKKEPLNEERW